MKPFSFELSAQDHLTLQPEASFPADFAAFVDSKGDKFRDDFTRACLYLASKNSKDDLKTDEEKSKSTVIVATEYGNLAAMFRFQRQIWSKDGSVSAQQFPHATTSSASTFVNIDRKWRGGNMTLNAGALNPAVAFLQALSHLSDFTAGSSHIFVGDVYSDLSVEDLLERGQTATSEVSYTAIRNGNTYEADFTFGIDLHEVLDDLRTPQAANIFMCGGWPPDRPAPTGWNFFADANSSIPTRRFFDRVRQLKSGEATLLVCSQSSRSIAARVTAR